MVQLKGTYKDHEVQLPEMVGKTIVKLGMVSGP